MPTPSGRLGPVSVGFSLPRLVIPPGPQPTESVRAVALLFVTFLTVANIFLVLRQRRWRPRDLAGERRLQVFADSPQALFSAI